MKSIFFKSQYSLLLVAVILICLSVSCEEDSTDDGFSAAGNDSISEVPYAGSTGISGTYGSALAGTGSPMGTSGTSTVAGSSTISSSSGGEIAGSASGEETINSGSGGEIAGLGGTDSAAIGDGILIDGKCFPICTDQGIDPDGDGWGWENQESCLVVDSEPYGRGTPCEREFSEQEGTGGTEGAGEPVDPLEEPEGYCRPLFTSGVNVAWFNFARDIPDPPIAQFNQLYDNIKPVGGKVVRWWFHTTGEVTPGYDSTGITQPIPQKHIDDLRSIVDSAQAAGVMIVVSLWGFDMIQDYVRADVRQNNLRLLTEDIARQAYIDNYLIPLVTALKGHKGIFAWEIFNEPEGMSEDHGWTTQKVSMEVIQKNVNWMVDAIRTADPDALVTNSAWTFITNSNTGDYKNYYSDEELIRVGGRAGGILDFYQVHYYDNWGAQGNSIVSPFAHHVSHWNLDKPVAIGEFWVLDIIYSGDYRADDMYTILYEQGYSGAWAWQYANIDDSNAEGYSQNGQVVAKWPTMEPSMRNLMSVAGADIDCQL